MIRYILEFPNSLCLEGCVLIATNLLLHVDFIGIEISLQHFESSFGGIVCKYDSP